MGSHNTYQKLAARRLRTELLEERLALTVPAFEVERLFVPDVSDIREIEARDLNGDDRLDLVVMGDEVIWLRNDGEGEFTKQAISSGRYLNETLTSGDILESTDAQDIVVVDIDADGDDDVLTAYEQRIVWSENLGGGVFEDRRDWLTSQLPDSLGRISSGGEFLEVADVDADGDMDLVVADNEVSESGAGIIYSADVFWFERLAEGSYSEPKLIERVRFPFFDVPVPEDEQSPVLHEIAVTDLDGDALLDVVVVGREKTSWFRYSAGEFQENILLEDGGQSASAVPLDVDSDGDTDLLTGADRWLANDGLGNFTPTGAGVPARVFDARLADFDADEAEDIVASLANAVVVGRAATGPQFEVDTAAQTATTVADFDGDSDLDVIYARGDEILWRANDGVGNVSDAAFLFQPQPLPIVVDPIDELPGELVAQADFDGDGLLDALMRMQEPITNPQGLAELHLHLNSAAGFFAPITVFSESPARLSHLIAVDLDQDSDLDLLVTRITDRESLLWIENLSEQNGEFGQPIEIPLPANLETLGRLFSLDGDLDGDLDVMSTQVWIENIDGKGEFAVHPLREPSFYSIGSAAKGDVDGDGHADLLVVSELLPDVELIRATSNGPVAEGVWRGELGFHVQTDFTTIQLTDFDGDGDLDGLMTFGGSHINVPSNGSTRLVLLENQNGQLSPGVTLPYRHDAVVVDWDEDGDADLIYDSIVLVNQSIVPSPIPGDANSDGQVDFDDFLIVAMNFGREGDLTFEDGDFDGNGLIDITDFLILADCFGTSPDDGHVSA